MDVVEFYVRTSPAPDLLHQHGVIYRLVFKQNTSCVFMYVYPSHIRPVGQMSFVLHCAPLSHRTWDTNALTCGQPDLNNGEAGVESLLSTTI
jgi:hypothetical protein